MSKKLLNPKYSHIEVKLLNPILVEGQHRDAGQIVRLDYYTAKGLIETGRAQAPKGWPQEFLK